MGFKRDYNCNEVPCTSILEEWKNMHDDLALAVKILKEEGCTAVYLFGSAAEGESGRVQDIDLAVKGCPTGEFFRVLGRLILELENPVDLINLDMNDDFAEFLEREGRLRRVA